MDRVAFDGCHSVFGSNSSDDHLKSTAVKKLRARYSRMSLVRRAALQPYLRKSEVMGAKDKPELLGGNIDDNK